MRRTIIHISVFLLLLLQQHLRGQEYTLSVTDLETTDAIAADIKDFFRDSDGFIWISSASGITRFDGHQFKVFNTINSKLRRYLLTRGRKMVEDEEGYIWIPGENTADLLHHSTFEIIHFEEKFPDATQYLNMDIIEKAQDGSIIFKLYGKDKLIKYNLKEGFKELDIDIKHPGFTLKGNTVWTHDRTGAHTKYDLETGEMLKDLSKNIIGRPNLVPTYTKSDLFWKVYNNQLSFYTAHRDSLELLTSYEAPVPFIPYWRALGYLPDRDVFLAKFSDDQIYVLDLKDNSMIPVESLELPVINFNSISEIDPKEIIWVSNRRRVQLLRLDTKRFRQFPPFGSNRGFWVNHEHLFCRENKVSISTGEIVEVATGDYNFNNVETRIRDELWYGGQFRIAKIDTNTMEILEEVHMNEKKGRFWCILRDQQANWWGGTIVDGLFYKSVDQDGFHFFDNYNGFDKPTGAIHLMEDGEHIWTASRNGLFCIHKEKGIVGRFFKDAPEGYRIPFNHILFIFKDAEGFLWVTSSGGGIMKLRLNQQLEIIESKHYTVEDGLSSNTVYTIVEDGDKRLWMSTFSGITCLDPATDNIQIFNKKDGIEELEFNRNAYAKGWDGQIFFGSLKGITGFHPDKVIRTSDLNSPIVATQFEVYNKEMNKWVDETSAINGQQKITLSPTDHFFRLSVSMQEYFDAQNIRYSYKIKGWLDEYQPIQGNTLEINGLPYGQYNLKIRGQAADGRFSNQELELPLTVMRPFYLQWWFTTLAVVFIVLSIIQIYYWRIQQLNQRQKELEWMVKERTAQIEKDKNVIEAQARQLKDLDELKSRFFANISHELRTPLTLVLAPLNDFFNSNNYTNKQFTQLMLMRQNGQKLLKRINELLDLSRLDANKLEIKEQPVFLYPFFKTTLSAFESAANLKGIQLLFDFKLPEEIQIMADEDKLEKIVSNYLDNALKFTPNGGQIILSATKAQNSLRIKVSDTGVGISDEDLNKIFDRFYQSPKNLGKGGTGIGLSLCRELAKVMDGKVWATSETGAGSHFYLEIPLVETFSMKAVDRKDKVALPPVVPFMAADTAPVTGAYRPPVLVVEDNPDLSTFLKMTLEEEYDITTAENGKQALDTLTTAPKDQIPTIIISDIMMPEMDGIELLNHLKTSEKWRHIPVIMLTARQNMKVKLEALRIGVDDYLTKPFQREELMARMKNLIANSQSRLEAASIQKPNDQPTLSAKDQKWIKEVEELLLENMGTEGFKLSDLSNDLHQSYSNIQRKIKQITGLSPKQYERSVKLAQARTLLKSGEIRTVSEVAAHLGFENHYYFSKMYKQAYGIMPTEELKG
ncbi:MAG: ATP-binding protein [Bacteroidota bacterium]